MRNFQSVNMWIIKLIYIPASRKGGREDYIQVPVLYCVCFPVFLRLWKKWRYCANPVSACMRILKDNRHSFFYLIKDDYLCISP